MKTVERTTDYRTEEVRETFVVCGHCGDERPPDESHPIDAAGHNTAWCTDCFVAEFGDVLPRKTVSISDSGSTKTSTLHTLARIPLLVAVAIRTAHAEFWSKVVKCLQSDWWEDQMWSVLMIMVYCVTMFAVGSLLTIIFWTLAGLVL